MNLNSPEDNFAKYFSGELTDEEKTDLIYWLKNNLEQAKAFANAKKIWNLAGLENDNENEAQDAFQNLIQLREKESLKESSKKIVTKTIKNNQDCCQCYYSFCIIYGLFSSKKNQHKQSN